MNNTGRWGRHNVSFDFQEFATLAHFLKILLAVDGEKKSEPKTSFRFDRYYATHDLSSATNDIERAHRVLDSVS